MGDPLDRRSDPRKIDLRARTRWIGSLAIHDVSSEQAVELIIEQARKGLGGYVCTPNADYVVKARRDEAFRRAVNGAMLRIADGMWIVYASLIAGRRIHRSATGRLLIPEISEAAVRAGLSVAFYGGAPGVAEAAAARSREALPGLQVAAAVSPPMGLVVGSEADQDSVRPLIDAGPAIVFVGLGAPRGATWMEGHTSDLPDSILIEIGAGIDLVAGRFKIAPRWMTRTGLEWLFRLAQEPRRLARRYLIEDPWILWWAFRTRLFGDRP